MDQGMFTVENVIRSASERDDLSILVFDEDYGDYIQRLASSFPQHKFFVMSNSSDKEFGLNNCFFSQMIEEFGQRYFDLNICMGRANAYDIARRVTDVLHLPLVVVDVCHAASQVKAPFYATPKVKSRDEMHMVKCDVAVGLDDMITKSWYSNFTGLATTIYPPTKEFKTTRSKILLDTAIPKDYIRSISIELKNSELTVDPAQAAIYVNLWQSITTKVLDCMASGIPVVTMKSQDFGSIIESKACVIIKDLKEVNEPNFKERILKFAEENETVENAYEYLKRHDQKAFKDRWTNLFNHLKEQNYMRY
jgi:hypothetical protein